MIVCTDRLATGYVFFVCFFFLHSIGNWLLYGFELSFVKRYAFWVW